MLVTTLLASLIAGSFPYDEPGPLVGARALVRPDSRTASAESPTPPAPQIQPSAATAATATPSPMNAFRKKAVRFSLGGPHASWFAPVTGEPITYLLPNGQRVTSVDALAFIGRNDLAERRSEAVAIAPFTNLTGLFGSLGLVAAGVVAGGAAGFVATNTAEGALMGTLFGTLGSALVALPIAYIFPQISTSLSPTELEVVNAVREYNLAQAQAQEIDVVDIPWNYLGP